MGKTLTVCTQFWRWLFIFLNIFFVLIGLTMIAVGIWLLLSDQDYAFLTATVYASPAALLIVAGVVTIIISIVGILGAAGMWYIVLIIYISFMVIIVILQIVAGILAAVYQDNVNDIVEDRVNDAIVDYRFNSSSEGYKSDVNTFIDFIQNQLDCCGYNSSADWTDTVFFNESDGLFPTSCECDVGDCSRCALFGGVCNASTLKSQIISTQLIWTRGCSSEVIEVLRNNLEVISGVGTAFGIFEISGVVIALALCVCACIKKRRKDDIELDEYVY